jgi:hypothetical protein
MGTSASTRISVKDGEHKNEMPAVPVREPKRGKVL